MTAPDASEETKTCRGCDTVKPVSAFPVYRYNLRPAATCKICEWRAERRRLQAHGVRYQTNRSWSALDDARLLALAAIGVMPVEAAGIIGRNPNCARQRLRRLVEHDYPELIAAVLQPRRPWKDEALIERVRVLIEDKGLSRGQVALKLGTTKNAITGAVQRYLPHLVKSTARLQ
jgi:hypothetical protein